MIARLFRRTPPQSHRNHPMRFSSARTFEVVVASVVTLQGAAAAVAQAPRVDSIAFAPARLIPYPERVRDVELRKTIVVDDLDGDGRLEAVLHSRQLSPSNAWTPTAWILEITTDALTVDLAIETPGLTGASGNNRAVQIAGADLDGDGDTDLVVREFLAPNFGGGFATEPESGTVPSRRITTLENQDGVFAAAGRNADEPANLDRSALGLVDLNGDGYKDVVAAQSSPNGQPALLLIGFGDGAAGFDEAQFIDLPELNRHVYAVVPAGDLNNDGAEDALLETFADGGPWALFGSIDGSPSVASLPPSSGYGEFDAFINVTGDDSLDFVGRGSCATFVGCCPFTRILTREGDGSGGFSPAVISLQSEGAAERLAFADLNGDGAGEILARFDIKCANPLNGVQFARIGIIANVPERGLHEIESLQIPRHVRGSDTNLQVGDIDGDGDLDLLLFYEDGVVVYERIEGAAAAADLNGDGRVDVADVEVWLQDWGGGATADLNGDGVVDVQDLSTLLRFIERAP